MKDKISIIIIIILIIFGFISYHLCSSYSEYIQEVKDNQKETNENEYQDQEIESDIYKEILKEQNGIPNEGYIIPYGDYVIRVDNPTNNGMNIHISGVDGKEVYSNVSKLYDSDDKTIIPTLSLDGKLYFVSEFCNPATLQFGYVDLTSPSKEFVKLKNLTEAGAEIHGNGFSCEDE